MASDGDRATKKKKKKLEKKKMKKSLSPVFSFQRFSSKATAMLLACEELGSASGLYADELSSRPSGASTTESLAPFSPSPSTPCLPLSCAATLVVAPCSFHP